MGSVTAQVQTGIADRQFGGSTAARTAMREARRGVDASEDALEELGYAATVANQTAGGIAEEQVEPHYDRLRGDDPGTVRASIADGFRALAVAAVTLFVTLFVVGMIADVMPSDGAFANESDEVESMTGDAFVLGGVALIILVASIILYLVGGFGGGNGGNAGGGRI